MLRPLLILLLIASLDAFMTDQLKKFCSSPFADSFHQGEKVHGRIVGDACVQTFPFRGSEEQHQNFCRWKLPFDSSMERTDNSQVICKWTAKKDCPQPHHTQIYGKCYHVGDCGHENMQIAKPTTMEEIQWLAVFYGDHQVLHVEQSEAFADKLKSGYFNHGFITQYRKEKSTKVALVLTGTDGLHMGDFVNAVSEILSRPELPMNCRSYTVI